MSSGAAAELDTMPSASVRKRTRRDASRDTFWNFGRRQSWLWPILAGAAVFHAVFIWRTSFTVEGQRYFVLVDDAMISMRYAQNLAHGHGLLWNVGQPPVEGITNPAWTIWMAAIQLLPLPQRLMSLPVMITSSVLLLATTVNAARVTALLSRSRIAPIAAAILSATFYPFIYWSLRGMEVGLLGFLIVTATLFVLRDASFEESSTRRWFSVLIVLMISTRLDAAVFVAVLVGGAIWLARPECRRRVAAWGFGVAAITIGLETLARRIYYGSILPNTYYLKVSHIPIHVRLNRGLPLLAADGVSNFGPYVVLAVAAVVVAVRRRDRRIAVLVAIVTAAALYSVWAGGDAFEELGFANRFLSTAAPVLMILAGLGVSEVVAIARRRDIARPVWIAATLAVVLWWMGSGGPKAPTYARLATHAAGWLKVLALIVLLVTLATAVAAVVVRRPTGDVRRRSSHRAVSPWRSAAAALIVALAAVAANQVQYRNWARTDVASFEQQLTRDAIRYRRATTPDAVIAYGAAGSAYFAGRRGVDLLGLSDAHVAREAPRNPVFHPGHDKYDYAYSLGQLRPDLVATVLPVPNVRGYRITGHDFEEVRKGTPRVNLALLARPVH